MKFRCFSSTAMDVCLSGGLRSSGPRRIRRALPLLLAVFAVCCLPRVALCDAPDTAPTVSVDSPSGATSTSVTPAESEAIHPGANSSHSAPTETALDVNSLKQRADAARLSERRIWRLLLHLQSGLFGSVSRSDGKGFFLSPDGDRYPSRELKANLDALVMPVGADANVHYRCRFPARAQFLIGALSIDTVQLPDPDCTDLKAFRKKFSAKALSLVYATANMDEPASMFGHTMLLVGQEDETPLDDPVVSFVARVTHSGFQRLYRGAFGGFEGTVEVANLAQRLVAYNTKESRNLWSFKLKTDAERLERLVNHLWEMNSTYFEYFYMDENCSFYNQYFIQVAFPELDIADMGYFSLPIEAVYLVLRHPQLLEEVTFYPAAKGVYRGGLRFLNPKEERLAHEIAKRPRAVASPKASILYKTALHHHWIQSYDHAKKLSDADKAIADQLTELLQSTGQDPKLTGPDRSNPTIGHGPHTVAIGAGYGLGGGGTGAVARNRASPFGTLDIRPLLHTLSESPMSYAPFSEIQFLSTRWRTRLDAPEIWLDHFTFASVYSLNKWRYGLFPKSWNLEAGARHLHPEGKPGYGTYLQGQLGMSLPLGDPGILSLLVGPIAELTPTLAGNYRLGGVAEGILILYLHTRWSLLARGGVRGYGLAELSLEPWGESALNIFVGSYLTIEANARYLPAVDSVEGWGRLKFHFF